MKKLISVICAVALVSTTVFAQPKNDKDGGKKWREKVRAEQIAFITSELNLTEAEAQAFWPVYNDVQVQRREAFKASGKAFKELQEGMEGDKVEKLLDEYLGTKKEIEKVEANAIARYKKVLPVEKVAKLLMAEENFRHMQINRLGKGSHHKGEGKKNQRPQKEEPKKQ